MRNEELGERTVGAADLAVLVGVICVALATWLCFAGSMGAPAWKPWLSVAVGLVLALAALTRHPGWARRFRSAVCFWAVTAPALLFASGAGMAWMCLGIGALVGVVAARTGFRGRRLAAG